MDIWVISNFCYHKHGWNEYLIHKSFRKYAGIFRGRNYRSGIAESKDKSAPLLHSHSNVWSFPTALPAERTVKVWHLQNAWWGRWFCPAFFKQDYFLLFNLKFYFFCGRNMRSTLWTDFKVYNTISLATGTRLYSGSLGLIHLLWFMLCPYLTETPHFPLPSAPGNHRSALCFHELDLFLSTHLSEITPYVLLHLTSVS